MTIQELFRKSDPETVFHAYTLIRPVFDEYDGHTMQEKAEALKKLREHIEGVCFQIRSCEIEKAEKAKTAFVIGRSRTSWGESYLQDMECFTTYDEEAKEAVKVNFTMWDDDGDTRLSFYGMDFERLSVIAGYKIATPSVSDYGIDVCCATILRDVFIWGLTEHQRRESYDDLTKRLDEAEKDIEAGRLVSIEELDDLFEEKCFKDASDDEKAHRKYEREYEDKVEDIESRYRDKVCQEAHKRFIDMVRREYDTSITF